MRSLKEYALAAEIVGAIAVVISLIYVGVSVNQNTNPVMVANHQALVAMDQDNTAWLRDPGFAEAYISAMDGVDRLSDAQRVGWVGMASSDRALLAVAAKRPEVIQAVFAAWRDAKSVGRSWPRRAAPTADANWRPMTCWPNEN